MRKVLVMAALPFFIAGCATNAVDPSLTDKPGVNLLRDGSGSAYIESVNISRSGHKLEKDDLPLCMSRSVSNRSVTLQGTSSTYVSPFTGIAYSENQTADISGGEALQYVSEDGREAVAQGVAEYYVTVVGLRNKKFLRYSLASKVSKEASEYHFSNLEQAFEDAGAANLMGFSKVGAWGGAKPEDAYHALERVADQIDSCLSAR